MLAEMGKDMEWMSGPPESHVYHHNVNDGPRISVEAERNSKGWNYSAHVSGAKSVEEALRLLQDATSALEKVYGKNAELPV